MRYGSLPTKAQAEQQLYYEGFTKLEYVRSTTGKYGPVLVYRGRRRAQTYNINVGRYVGTDILDVRARVARENPKEFPPSALWEAHALARVIDHPAMARRAREASSEVQVCLDAILAGDIEGAQYKHECLACRFLGRHRHMALYRTEERGEWRVPTDMDLYACVSPTGMVTFIARRSSEGSDYASGLESSVAQMEASGLESTLSGALREARNRYEAAMAKKNPSFYKKMRDREKLISRLQEEASEVYTREFDPSEPAHVAKKNPRNPYFKMLFRKNPSVKHLKPGYQKLVGADWFSNPKAFAAYKAGVPAEEFVGGKKKPKAKARPPQRSKPKKTSKKTPKVETLVTRLPRGKGKLFDPREEGIRAQRQGIYESQVRKLLGKPYNAPFRDNKGMRLDAKNPRVVGKAGPAMWKISTRVGQRYGRLYEGQQLVTPKAIAEAMQRYNNADDLLRNRQDYEETLAMMRKGGFYRVTPEPTRYGLQYFVWPLPPKQPLPQGADTLGEAQAYAAHLNATADPRSTGRWWKPPKKKYNKRMLDHWLPPLDVFSPRWAPSAQPSKRRRKKTG